MVVIFLISLKQKIRGPGAASEKASIAIINRNLIPGHGILSVGLTPPPLMRRRFQLAPLFSASAMTSRSKPGRCCKKKIGRRRIGDQPARLVFEFTRLLDEIFMVKRAAALANCVVYQSPDLVH